MEQINLPADLAAFYAILSNPIMAPIWLSMILEQTPFIQNPAVANWKKLLLTFGVALVWAILAVVFNPNTPFVFGANGVYAIFRAAFALCFGMNVWNKIATQALPWLHDFLLTFFNRTNVTVVKTEPTVTTSTEAGSTTSVVSAKLVG